MYNLMSKRKHNKSFLLLEFRGVVHAESENPFQRAVMSDVVFAAFRQRLLRQRFRVFAALKRESELKHEPCLRNFIQRWYISIV